MSVTATPIAGTAVLIASVSADWDQMHYGKTYTCCTFFDNVSGSIAGATTYYAGTHNTIYRNTDTYTTDGYFVEILERTAANTSGYSYQRCSIQFDTTKGEVPGSIRIKLCAVYEGEFKHPPMTTSIDCMKSPMFMTRNMYNKMYTPVYTFNQYNIATGWYKLACLGVGSSVGSKYSEFYITRTYHAGVPMVDLLKIGYSIKGGPTLFDFNLEATRAANAEPYLTKYRLAIYTYDSVKYIMLEAYMSASSHKDENIYVILKDSITNNADYSYIYNYVCTTSIVIPRLDGLTPTNTYTEVTPRVLES